MAKIETRLFINGQFVEAKTAARLTCYNPADNSVVTSDLHVATKEDVDAAVAAARAAFPAWSNSPAQVRSKALLKVADLIEERGDELANLDAICMGKPVSMKTFELSLVAQMFRYYAGWCDKLGGESFPADNGFMRIVRREAIGVCAAINPFNGPTLQLGMKVAPCLAAGNTMIVKASEKVPLSTLYIAELMNEAGVPPGVFQVVNGPGETGALLASHMGIDKISFTGSSIVGRKIAQAAAASNLKKVALELGGKSPSIVFADANLEVAAEWCARGIVINAGQVCVASSRVYVHKDIRDAFIEMMKVRLEGAAAATGDPTKETTAMGALADKAQFDRVSKYVEEGKSEATLITGGGPLPGEGCFFKPTIFVDPKPEARIYKEEIFGPVVVISEFTDEADAIARANDTTYGLAGAVFSQDINRAMRVSSQIQSGTVCINCCALLDPAVPFGGYKSSGWGRELGKEGIDAYTHTKSVFVNMTY